MSVKPLYKEIRHSRESVCVYPIPTLCLCDFEKSLTDIITELSSVLNDNELTEVAKQTTCVVWFFEQTNRYHINIPSCIHVTASEVYFSGCLAPYKQKYFITSKVPMNEVLANAGTFKPVDMTRLKLPLAKALIKELDFKYQEYEKISDRYYALDEVLEALIKLDNNTAEELDSEGSSYSNALSGEIGSLNKQRERLELEMENLAKKLLNRAFGLSVGDWICTDSTWRVEKKIQLKIEQVDYYNKTITLFGPIITQKGQLGKTSKSIQIRLFTKDEH